MLLKHFWLFLSLIGGGGPRLNTAPGQQTSNPRRLRHNSVDPSSKWLVQKFGGTSIGKYPVNIARDIVPRYMDSETKVAIVCSARSGSTKALGTTSLLLRAASETLQQDPETRVLVNGDNAVVLEEGSQFYTTVELIRGEHLTAARASIENPDILQELEVEFLRDFEWLRSFLLASQIIGEISPQSKDAIVSLGERLACKLMAAVLRDQGIEAECIPLENIVDDLDLGDNDQGVSLDQDFYDRLSHALGERINQCRACVPVVTGFFGPVPGSLLRHVGRGYTDMLSALLAVGLDATELQIWKEVDGIFTADPHKVPAAHLIPVISAADATEMTYFGSEVVHPFTMEQAMQRRIPIHIKNVQNPNGRGTIILPDLEDDMGHELGADWEERLSTAVSIKEHIIVLTITSNRKTPSHDHGFMARAFAALDWYGVPVVLISHTQLHMRVAVEDTLELKSVFEQVLAELEKSRTVTVQREMSILSLVVGKHTNSMSGGPGRMFTTIAEGLGLGGVDVEMMISQGPSVLCVVVDGRDGVK